MDTTAADAGEETTPTSPQESRENIDSLISTIAENTPEVGHVLSHLIRRVDTQEMEINGLKNEVYELEKRIRDQERYSSKDCLIFRNPPLQDTNDLGAQMARFIHQSTGLMITAQRFKACHLLGRCDDLRSPPFLIVKFLHFQDKETIWRARNHISNFTNPMNNAPITVFERLPSSDLEVKKYAERQGLATSTNNCAVKLQFKRENGTYFQEEVRTKSDVDRYASFKSAVRMETRDPQRQARDLPMRAPPQHHMRGQPVPADKRKPERTPTGKDLIGNVSTMSDDELKGMLSGMETADVIKLIRNEIFS
jgi:hypothetical protein